MCSIRKLSRRGIVKKRLTGRHDVIDARPRLSGQRVGGPAQERAEVRHPELDHVHGPVRGGHVDQTGYGVVERPAERRRARVAIDVALDPRGLTLVRSVHVLLVGLARRLVCKRKKKKK